MFVVLETASQSLAAMKHAAFPCSPEKNVRNRMLFQKSSILSSWKSDLVENLLFRSCAWIS
jgi:hypothetical protein